MLDFEAYFACFKNTEFINEAFQFHWLGFSVGFLSPFSQILRIYNRKAVVGLFIVQCLLTYCIGVFYFRSRPGVALS